MYNCVNCVLKQTIKNLKEKLVLSGEYVIPLDINNPNDRSFLQIFLQLLSQEHHLI